MLGVFTIFAVSPAARAETTLLKPDSGCLRSYVYRNRTYPVDSSRKLDAEGLRKLFNKSPQSEALLNDYQSNLKSSYIPAYVGSLGIGMAVGGSIYANTLQSPIGQRDTRYLFIFSGLFLTLASYAYGQFAVVQREKVLEKAIQTYNDSVPATERIRVDLTPLPTGDGGAIKAEVPF